MSTELQIPCIVPYASKILSKWLSSSFLCFCCHLSRIQCDSKNTMKLNEKKTLQTDGKKFLKIYNCLNASIKIGIDDEKIYIQIHTLHDTINALFLKKKIRQSSTCAMDRYNIMQMLMHSS